MWKKLIEFEYNNVWKNVLSGMICTLVGSAIIWCIVALWMSITEMLGEQL